MADLDKNHFHKLHCKELHTQSKWYVQLFPSSIFHYSQYSLQLIASKEICQNWLKFVLTGIYLNGIPKVRMGFKGEVL